MVYFFIDESGEGFHAKGFAALCAVVITNPIQIGLEINTLREKILHDLRFKEILDKFPTEGFHYTSNHREIKNVFIPFLRSLTFQAYICFNPNVTGDNPKNITYDKLLKKLLRNRLRDHKTEEITICFEQHDKPEGRVADILDIVSEEINKINVSDKSAFSGTYKVISGSKKDMCLSIADYICGVFKACFEEKTGGEKESVQRRDFEDLRMKIRCIHNIAIDKFYDRRNPFS